jgi:ATP-dependent DNA helicase RecG
MTQHDLEAMQQSGEGYIVEFKRNVNSDLAKELVAFANSSGGRIFIGIEDDGSIVGIPINNDLRSRVQMTARDCDPPISVELETFNNILIVHVPEGKDKPYRCTNGFYIRSGACSVKLSTQEIIDFIKTEGRVRFDELQVPSLDYNLEMDEAASKRFIRLSGISEVIGIKEMLINLGVLQFDRTKAILNNAGVLLFAKHPTRILPHAVISCVLFKGNKKVHIIDRKIFDFDLLTNIDQTIAFLERHLNISYEIKAIRRKDILEIPKEVLREGVINAVTHRDYFERGANVVVEIFDNRVEITNPGGLSKGLRPENFGKQSLTRNPIIAGLLQRCKYVEKAGTGIQRMREGMREAGLPEPTFEFTPFFTVMFLRYNMIEEIKKEFGLNDKRSERIITILRQMVMHQIIDVSKIANELSTTSRTLRNDLELLKKEGWINSSGSTKGREYELSDLAKEKLSRYV